MRMVVQPLGSSMCGQCCVAMVTKKPLIDVIKAFGHVKATRTKEVVKALRHFGFDCNDKLKRFTNYSGLPDLGIGHVIYDTRKHEGHWVAIINADGDVDYQVYCPSGEISSWLTYGTHKGRIASFLEVKKIK